MSTLYSDSLVEITDESITFKKFYWKLRYRPKRVELADISRVEMRPPTFQDGKWKLFGMGFDPNNWFPMDWHRPSRDKIFVAFLRGPGERLAFKFRLRSISFTVKDSKRVAEILRQKGLLNGKQSA